MAPHVSLNYDDLPVSSHIVSTEYTQVSYKSHSRSGRGALIRRLGLRPSALRYCLRLRSERGLDSCLLGLFGPLLFGQPLSTPPLSLRSPSGTLSSLRLSLLCCHLGCRLICFDRRGRRSHNCRLLADSLRRDKNGAL